MEVVMEKVLVPVGMLVVLWTLIIGGVFWLFGCTSTTGWGVAFDVHPITAMHDEQGLNRQELDRRGEFSTVAPKL
jgi:hypothetical protein